MEIQLTSVSPDETLDGARTSDRRRLVWTMDLVPTWVQAEDDLSWAKAAPAMGTPFGHDAAVCYAKRAVCRLIDSLILYNHLGRWVGDTYPSKIDLGSTRRPRPVPMDDLRTTFDPRSSTRRTR